MISHGTSAGSHATNTEHLCPICGAFSPFSVLLANVGSEQSLNIKFMICSNSVQTPFKQCSNKVQIQTLFIHCSNSFIKIQTLFIVCSIFVLPFSWSDLEGKLCSQFVQVQGSQKCHILIVFKLCSSYNFKFIPCSNFVQTLFNGQWIELLQKSNSYSVQTLFKI